MNDKIQGWCPDAYRPMRAGDGLILRVKPMLNRLSKVQAHAIAEISNQFGNGVITITNRANLQVRGLKSNDHQAALERLDKCGLLSCEKREQSRNIIVTPNWVNGDMNSQVHALLLKALPDFPKLPSKFGYAIDCGTNRLIADASSDIHFESADDQSVVIRADGAALGKRVHINNLITELGEFLNWFSQNKNINETRGRMRNISNELPVRFATDEVIRPRAKLPFSDKHIGLAYGELNADLLANIADKNNSIQITPWRSLIIENAPISRHFMSNENDLRRSITICTGYPRCLSGYQATKSLADKIGSMIKTPKDIHVSGCEKRCASQASHALNIIGTSTGFDLYVGNEKTPSWHGNNEQDTMMYIKENHAL